MKKLSDESSHSACRGGLACLVAATSMLACSGCVDCLIDRQYPMTVQVVDKGGNGLEGIAVKVVCYTVATTNRRVPRPPVEAKTDEQGRAELSLREKSCETQFLGLTVSRPGLTAVTLRLGDSGRQGMARFERDFSTTLTDLGVLTYENGICSR